jgi:hypothetical protein
MIKKLSMLSAPDNGPRYTLSGLIHLDDHDSLIIQSVLAPAFPARASKTRTVLCLVIRGNLEDAALDLSGPNHPL